MNRWMGIVLAASGIWVCSPGSARPAADYPSRPIKVIVPWPAGGMVDTRVRRIADRLSKQVGQPVVVENRPGASGVLGMSALAKAPRDGYTIGFGSVNDLAIVQAMGISLSYDANRNLQPVTRMYVSSNLVVEIGRASCRERV